MSNTDNKDIPNFFRLNLEVGDLDEAADFYASLLGIEGRRQAGSRCYFTCGPVTLQVVDVSSASEPHPAAKALYFTVKDLDAIFERAVALDCMIGRNSLVGKRHQDKGFEDAVRFHFGQQLHLRVCGFRVFRGLDNGPECFSLLLHETAAGHE